MSLFDENGRVLISPSRLKAWVDCPLKWKAVYIDELRYPASPSMVFGSAIHKALETFHRGLWCSTPASPDELLKLFNETLQEESHPPGSDPLLLDEDEMAKQAKGLLDLYVSRYGTEKVAAAELSLTTAVIDLATGEDLGATLVGVIDLITSEGTVVDVKTSARTSDLFDLTISHSVQLDAYRYLLHSSGAAAKEMEIRLLVRTKVPRVEAFQLPAKKSFESFLSLCRGYVDFVRCMEVPRPRPGIFCGPGCPAYSQCRAHHGLEVA